MPVFSQKSKDNLATCHPDLQRLFNRVIELVDCSILEGHRGKEAQDAAVAAGNSKTPWPTGKHNSLPSMAVDVMPYPIDFNDTKRLYFFIGFVKGIATQMGIKVRCGADWNGNFQVLDEKFVDIPHVELIS